MTDAAAQFVRLWTQFHPEVRRYIRVMIPQSVDAQDVLQETASRLWEKFEEYDPERPFVAWAVRFAYLEVLNWRRRQSRDRLVFSDKLLARLDSRIEDEISQFDSRRQALNGCLQKLTVPQRRLLLKRYAEHGAVKREAERTNTSVHKLYYSIDKIRVGLLACIESSLAKEGLRND